MEFSHKSGILNLLGCDATRDSVQEALLGWDAQAFEDAAAENKMCATAYRTLEQWDQHAQAKALLGTPPVEIVKVGEAPKRPVNELADRPLGGIRVLDLTRVLAGPIVEEHSQVSLYFIRIRTYI